MKSRFRKLAVESLEGRSVLSTMIEADFNSDGYFDVAKVTDPNTITVSLNNGNNGYDVSAILTTPKSQPISGIFVGDYDHDGDLDISAWSFTKKGDWYDHSWQGDDDGNFGNRNTHKVSFAGW